MMVASPGIEPGSGASETLILSIVLRGPYLLKRLFIYSLIGACLTYLKIAAFPNCLTN